MTLQQRVLSAGAGLVFGVFFGTVTTVFTSAALAEASFESGVAAYQRGDYTGAFPVFRRLAEQGNPRAQTVLALMYNYGEGVRIDRREALKWYTRAAEQGYGVAQFNLGVLYANGNEVVSPDRSQAVKWLKLAADNGHSRAEEKLAELSSTASRSARTVRPTSIPTPVTESVGRTSKQTTPTIPSGKTESARPNAQASNGSSLQSAGTSAAPTKRATNTIASSRPAPSNAAVVYRVQLAASKSETALRRDWSLYKSRHAALLEAVDGTIERAEVGADKTVWYRLRVGPLPSEARARELCDELRQRGTKTGCLLLREGG